MSLPARTDVVVLGGGIVGLASARALAHRGLSVVVLEQGDLEGDGWGADGAASWASAGMLAPLAEVPEPGPFFEICRAARDLWTHWAPQLEAEAGLTLDHDRSGALILARSPSRFDALRDAAERVGEPWRAIDRDALRHLVPAVDPDAVALHLPAEHRVDNRRVVEALVFALRRHERVVVAPGHRTISVQAVGGGPGGGLRAGDLRVAGRRVAGRRVAGRAGDDRDGEPFTIDAERVLVAAGAWSSGIDGLPPLPVAPVRGQMLRLDGVAWPFTGCLREGDFYAVCRGPSSSTPGSLLVGATVEADAGFEVACTPSGIETLRDWLRRWLPGLAEREPAAAWAGLRPATPDRLPLVGPCPLVEPGRDLPQDATAARLWLATAHYRNGILLAPWTAEVLVAAMLDGTSLPEVVHPSRLLLYSPEVTERTSGCAEALPVT